MYVPRSATMTERGRHDATVLQTNRHMTDRRHMMAIAEPLHGKGRLKYRGGFTGCPGCPDNRSLDTVPYFEKNYFQNGRRMDGFWDYGVAKFPKIRDSMPRTPMNHRAKFDAASFIPGGEIRNVQNDKFTNKQTNSNRHIHTLPISMCGNDNQRLKLNKNRPSVGQHQLRI